MKIRASAFIVGAAVLVALVAPATASAHGLGGIRDLPIPGWLFLFGGATVSIVSFLALGVLWREPRLDAKAGTPLPGLDAAGGLLASRPGCCEHALVAGLRARVERGRLWHRPAQPEPCSDVGLRPPLGRDPGGLGDLRKRVVRARPLAHGGRRRCLAVSAPRCPTRRFRVSAVAGDLAGRGLAWLLHGARTGLPRPGEAAGPGIRDPSVQRRQSVGDGGLRPPGLGREG